jgi:hypothetical protein
MILQPPMIAPHPLFHFGQRVFEGPICFGADPGGLQDNARRQVGTAVYDNFVPPLFDCDVSIKTPIKILSDGCFQSIGNTLVKRLADLHVSPCDLYGHTVLRSSDPHYIAPSTRGEGLKSA